MSRYDTRRSSTTSRFSFCLDALTVSSPASSALRLFLLGGRGFNHLAVSHVALNDTRGLKIKEEGWHLWQGLLFKLVFNCQYCYQHSLLS